MILIISAWNHEALPLCILARARPGDLRLGARDHKIAPAHIVARARTNNLCGTGTRPSADNGRAWGLIKPRVNLNKHEQENIYIMIKNNDENGLKMKKGILMIKIFKRENCVMT